MEKSLLREYVRLVLEMPHLELDGCRVRSPAGVCASVIDFRIELLPIAAEERRSLMRAFNGSGFVGTVGDKTFVFSAERAAREASDDEAARLPHLPDVWTQNAVFIED